MKHDCVTALSLVRAAKQSCEEIGVTTQRFISSQDGRRRLITECCVMFVYLCLCTCACLFVCGGIKSPAESQNCSWNILCFSKNAEKSLKPWHQLSHNSAACVPLCPLCCCVCSAHITSNSRSYKQLCGKTTNVNLPGRLRVTELHKYQHVCDEFVAQKSEPSQLHTENNTVPTADSGLG